MSCLSYLGTRGDGHVFKGLLATSLIAISLCNTRPAWAVGSETTDPTAKGIVGGALVGGEAVMLVEAALGVKPWWGYAIGGGAGAIAGGIGGFFLAEADTGAAPMALLTAGLILAVPTTVAILSATAYSPEGEVKADTATKGLQMARLRAPSLLALDERQGLSFGMPGLSVSDVYSPRLRLTYGLPAETQVNLPLLDVKF